MSLKSFLDWCYNSHALGIIRDTKYGIPLMQSVHLCGLAALLGCVLMLNLRLMGIGMLRIPQRTVADQLLPWIWKSLIVTICAGIVIFIVDPVRYAANTPFRIKMSLLATAILFHFFVYRRIARSPVQTRTSPGHVAAAVSSLLLWFGIGWSGRLIAFFM